MEKKSQNDLVVERIIKYYFSPYFQNVIVNANENIQKGIVKEIGSEFKEEGKTFHTININGSDLFNELRPLTLEMEYFCNKNGIEYEEVNKEYYRFQNADIESMSQEELSNFIIALWDIENKRNQDSRSRMIMRAMYERYLISKIYIRIKEVATNLNLNSSSYLLKEIDINELLKLKKYIIDGDIDGALDVKCSLSTYSLENLCIDLYKSKHAFVMLVDHGENIIDYDLHDVFNIIMSLRSSAISVSFMTRIQKMYSYYTSGPGRLFLEETHDIKTTDVKRLILNQNR